VTNKVVTFYPMSTSYCIQVERCWEWEQESALAEASLSFEVPWGPGYGADVIIVEEVTTDD